MKRFIAREILVILAILGVSIALWLQVILGQEQVIPGQEYNPLVLESGTPITLQEARAKSPFAFMPVYLPESLSLRRVTGFRGPLNEKDNLYDEIRLFYSDRPITILPLDPSGVQKYPAAPKLAVITTRTIGNTPDEKWIYNWVTETNQKLGREIFTVTGVRGRVGIGIDLGHTNRYRDGSEESIPASLIWWEGGRRVEVRGMLPLEELLKTAESMFDITSISPNEFSKIPEPTNDIVERITPIDDVHVAEGYPDRNFGDSISLFLQSYTKNYKNERVFLKFDLSLIPADSEIVQARLYLYSWKGRHAPINAQVHGVDDDSWTEDTITWNNQPAHGGVLDTVYLQNLEAEGKWHSWDVSSFVRSELAGDKVTSFSLRAEIENESGHYVFWSEEWWANAVILEVVYTPPPYATIISPREESKVGLAGTGLIYTVEIANKGSMEETYSLSVGDELGWVTTISPASLRLTPGQSGIAVVRVVLPQNVPPDLEDSVTVTATSSVGPSTYVLSAKVVDKIVENIFSIDDAHVAEGYPDSNLGDGTALYLQSYTENYKNERVFLKFDFSSIPAGSGIVQARLYLYSWKGRYAPINAQVLGIDDDSWIEDTITWNNQPSTGEVLDAVLLDNVTVKNNWHSWDVTRFVAGEFAGDKIASLCLKAEVEGVSGQYVFESKEWRKTSLRPYLEITYRK